jgi:hypothetical protein
MGTLERDNHEPSNISPMKKEKMEISLARIEGATTIETTA